MKARHVLTCPRSDSDSTPKRFKDAVDAVRGANGQTSPPSAQRGGGRGERVSHESTSDFASRALAEGFIPKAPPDFGGAIGAMNTSTVPILGSASRGRGTVQPRGGSGHVPPISGAPFRNYRGRGTSSKAVGELDHGRPETPPPKAANEASRQVRPSLPLEPSNSPEPASLWRPLLKLATPPAPAHASQPPSGSANEPETRTYA